MKPPKSRPIRRDPDRPGRFRRTSWAVCRRAPYPQQLAVAALQGLPLAQALKHRTRRRSAASYTYWKPANFKCPIDLIEAISSWK
jgi:hypothetical protein